MLLKSLHLHNYRRYRNQYVEFPNEMIGIVGKNGTGKSTLIEAVGWCIYGRARTGNEEVRTSSAPPGEECAVKLEIEVGQDRFTVERRLRGKSTMASVHVNGGRTAQATGKDVSNFMATRIGMDLMAFTASVFAQQKELDAFSNLRSNERKKVVMRLLGIDSVDHAIIEIRRDHADCKREADTLKTTVKGVDVLEKERQEKMRERSYVTTLLRKARSRQSSCEKKAEALQKDVERQEGLRNVYDRAAAELAKYEAFEKSRVESVKDTARELREAKRAQARLDVLLPQVAGYEKEKGRVDGMDRDLLKFQELESARIQIKKLKAVAAGERKKNSVTRTRLAKLDGLVLEMGRVSKRLERLESDRKILDKKRSEIDQRKHVTRTKMEKINGDLESIRSLGEGMCPTCCRPLGSRLEPTIRNMEEQKRSLGGDMEYIEKEAEATEAKIAKMDAGIRSGNESISLLETKARDKASLEATLVAGEESLTSAESEIRAYEQEAARFEDLRYDRHEHARAKSRLASMSKKHDQKIRLEGDADRVPGLEARIRTLEDEADGARESIREQKAVIGRIGFDRNTYDKIKRRSKAADKTLLNQTVQTARLEGDLSLIMSLLKQIKDSIADEKDTAKKIERLADRAEMLSKLEDLMNDFKMDLMSRIRPALSHRMSGLLSRMTDGRYQSVEIDDSYGITIGDAGGSFTTARFSGGEQDLASLCLRIAISQEIADRAGITGPNFVVLDEIFGSQDAERKDRVLGVLSEISSQFRQILLITHIEEVKELLPYALHVIESSDGTVRIEVEGRRPEGLTE